MDKEVDKMRNNLNSQIDILSIDLKDTKNKLYKLRIVVSLITEMIREEYTNKVQKEWLKEDFKRSYYNFRFLEYFNKEINSSAAKEYVYSHKYWRYLNELLERKNNVNIKLYDTISSFPYISICYDDFKNINHGYLKFGLKRSMTKKEIIDKLEYLIYDSDILLMRC